VALPVGQGGGTTLFCDKALMDRLAGQQVGDGQIEPVEDLGEWIRLVV